MVEPLSEVAKSGIDALKTSPSCLVAMLFGLGIGVLTFFAMQSERDRQHEEQMALYSKCFDHIDLKPRSGPPND